MELIWLTEERCFGYLLEMGAYYSRVIFKRDGMEYDTYIENDEYEIWEPFEHEG